MPTTTQQTTDQYVDITVCGVLIPRMKVMTSQYKGKCNRSGRWFEPGTVIGFKHKDYLTPPQKAAIFGNGTVYHVTVVLDPVEQGCEVSNISVVQQAQAAITTPKQVGDWVPSVYQGTILDRVLNAHKHVFIEALAGCGKTQTLVWIVKELQRRGLTKGQAIVYLAFNKSIQQELVKKLMGTGCPASTTHAFCFSVLKKAFKELEAAGDKAVFKGKTKLLFEEMLADDMGLDYSGNSMKKVKKSEQYKCRSSVVGNSGLVGFIKNWAIIPDWTGECYRFNAAQKERIKGFLDEYEITVPEGFTADQLVDYACCVTVRGIPLPGEPLLQISYDDMLYLPLVLDLKLPKYDLVLTDESQDFNEAQEQILFRLVSEKGRAIVVGDENQAIYRFRGADSKAFKRINECLARTERGCESCDLPINYRSDEAIIEHARQWVPKLQGRGAALGQQKGEVRFDVTYGQSLQYVNNDGTEEFAFLCRINVPLVITAYQLISQGKKVCIIGRQAIASPMLSIIDDLCGKPDRWGKLPEGGVNRISDEKDGDGDIVVQGLMSRLADYYRTQAKKLTEEKHEQALEDLSNNCDCIEIIAGRVNEDTVEAVRNEIESLFTEESDDKRVIKLSTVHRAKGLEFDTVLVLRPELMPHPNAKPNPDGTWSEDQQQEQNIQYVAATRAKHKLWYICNWPFGRGKSTKLSGGVNVGTEPGSPVGVKPVQKPTLTQDSTVKQDRYPTPRPAVQPATIAVNPLPVKKGPGKAAPTFVDDGKPF